jgi:hypothetical protein
MEERQKTISTVKEEKIEQPTGIEKMKLTTNATKDTEDESNTSDNNVFRTM